MNHLGQSRPWDKTALNYHGPAWAEKHLPALAFNQNTHCSLLTDETVKGVLKDRTFNGTQ